MEERLKDLPLRHNGPEHVLCYAPPRSGKGVGLVVPTMLTWPHSAVVTDLKREIYELTAGWRRTEARNRILRFEPASSSHSVHFNPLDEIRIGTEHETGDIQNLANLIEIATYLAAEMAENRVDTMQKWVQPKPTRACMIRAQ
jgi:type IV secretion system protein VirD4